MNAQQLYDEIKDALRYFGLAFNQMDHMSVFIRGKCVVFSYNNRHLYVEIKEEQ